MSIVRINAIEVPEGMGPVLEERFAARLGAVDKAPGFEGFELLRPTGEAEKRYFVVTHWRSVEDFDNWVASDDFGRGHSGANDPATPGSGGSDPATPGSGGSDPATPGSGGHPGGHPGGGHGGGHPGGSGPVSTGSAILEFDVVMESKPN